MSNKIKVPETAQQIMDAVPNHVRLSWATETQRLNSNGEFDKEGGLRHVFQILFSQTGFGFGEITFVSQDRHLMIDAERMSKDKIKEFLGLRLCIRAIFWSALMAHCKPESG